MIELDGSHGEGGGQMVRTALALSTITGQPFTISHIREGRKEQGLKHQHLHCVKALQELCNAEVFCATLGSTQLTFQPSKLSAKTLYVDIGTAGSITLLLQSLLLPSIFAERDMRIKIIGGTDTLWSMPIDYFKSVLLPHLQKFATLELSVEKRGYFPKGGGRIDLKIKQHYRAIDFSNMESMLSFLWDEKKSVELLERGKLALIKGVSHASVDLELQQVATRQARAAKVWLSSYNVPVNIDVEYHTTASTGSGIVLWANFVQEQGGFIETNMINPVRIAGDALGEKGVKAEIVGETAAKALSLQLSKEGCVDSHLTDNLIPFMAFFGGRMRCGEITEHCKSNIEVVEAFLPVKYSIADNIISVKRI